MVLAVPRLEGSLGRYSLSAKIEHVAVSHVLSFGDLGAFLGAAITPDFFAEKKWNKAWLWITEYFAKHGQPPGPAAFRRQFPSYEVLPPDDEPVTAIIEELRAQRRRLLTLTGLQDAVGQFDEGNTEEALQAAQRMLTDVASQSSNSSVDKSSECIGSIVLDVLSRKGLSLLGIPTGFPTIDEATGGLQDEQLITLAALPKCGKSTILLAIAMAAQQSGHRVMLRTKEMSKLEMWQRYLSLGAHVSLNNILRGSLTEQDRDALRDFEGEVLDMPDLEVIQDIGATTVSAIRADVQQRNPDIVMIDGAYMLTDELGATDDWLRLTNITRALKSTAQWVKKPFVISTQGLISKTSKKKGMQMGSVGYSSSFAQDSDALFGLDREDLTIPKARLKVIAARNSLGMEVDIRFDYGIGIVEEEGNYSMFRAARLGVDDDE